MRHGTSVPARSTRTLYLGILPLVLILSFAMTLRIAQAFVTRDPGRFVVRPEGGLPGGGDAYLTSTLIAFVAVAAAGYGVVFFMQGLICSLYFREGRNE